MALERCVIPVHKKAYPLQKPSPVYYTFVTVRS